MGESLSLEQRPTAAVLSSGGPWREEGRTLACLFLYQLTLVVGNMVDAAKVL